MFRYASVHCFFILKAEKSKSCQSKRERIIKKMFAQESSFYNTLYLKTVFNIENRINNSDGGEKRRRERKRKRNMYKKREKKDYNWKNYWLITFFPAIDLLWCLIWELRIINVYVNLEIIIILPKLRKLRFF